MGTTSSHHYTRSNNNDVRAKTELQKYLKVRFPNMKGKILCFDTIAEVETKCLVKADRILLHHWIQRRPDQQYIRYCDLIDDWSKVEWLTTKTITDIKLSYVNKPFYMVTSGSVYITTSSSTQNWMIDFYFKEPGCCHHCGHSLHCISINDPNPRYQVHRLSDSYAFIRDEYSTSNDIDTYREEKDNNYCGDCANMYAREDTITYINSRIDHYNIIRKSKQSEPEMQRIQKVREARMERIKDMVAFT